MWIMLGATANNSSINSCEKRCLAKAKCLNSWVSAIRPTRSWTFTKRYFSFTTALLIAFGGANLSLMILNTMSNEGKVNTLMTIPLMPGAIIN